MSSQEVHFCYTLCLVKYLESTAQSNSGDAEKEALPGEGVGTQDGWGRSRDHKAGERWAGNKNADRLLVVGGTSKRGIEKRKGVHLRGLFFKESFIH